MSASRPTCERCPYWEKGSKSPEEGHCHVDRPRIVDSDNEFGFFPATFADEWCGKHPDFPKTERTAPKLGPESVADRMPPQPGARQLAPGSVVLVDDLQKAVKKCPAEKQLTEQTLDEDSTWARCILPWSHTAPCLFEAVAP